MLNASRLAQLVSAFVCAALVASACGSSDSRDRPFEVTSEVVSHKTTQDILVFAPDAEGSWPVISAMHGVGGTSEDMAEIASRLASEGFVVFAPTYRSDMTTQEGVFDAVRDAECGYRFARTIAADYGGDLDQPVTFMGWSLGASLVLEGGLTEEIDPSQEVVKCFTEVPRADVIVAISGCHYEFEGAQFDFDLTGWENRDADVVLLAGEDDTICAAWQSEDAAAELRSAGFDVELVMLESADHFGPIFHELVDGDLVVAAEDPAGAQTVQVIVDAVAAGQAGS
jgi:dienelactone hydrolase